MTMFGIKASGRVIATDLEQENAGCCTLMTNPLAILTVRISVCSRSRFAPVAAEVSPRHHSVKTTQRPVAALSKGVTRNIGLVQEHRDIWKRGVGVQIVNGLKQVVAHRPASDVLTRLSSHWILVNTSGNVRLKLQMTREEAEQEAALTQMQNPQPPPNLEQDMNQPAEMNQEAHTEKSGMDGLRWRAPEVVLAGGVVGQVDGSKASVFSLGLILWEIETGQVPFGELDAVNAQRQSGTGIGPKMESLENEEFISLIHRCASVDPNQRPTLSEIGEFLSSHADENRVGSGMDMKDP
ncbi:hypothetical protein BLNAU_1921 [Blattamonas nauphoetae]|uniref:Protein kinase domain-containing protein n=1 Tax=Blattamonas nauphoetae TaxID=2049346 RepID=A0ABQ9YGK1_9EUKA|nr:hypothetical protein BLNAU_1921 [Blattamonas nauphoetae]